MKTAAIVLAAGSGKRMYEGAERLTAGEKRVKKQYMEIGGRPILYYALKAFQDAGVDEIVLVTGAEEIDYCRDEIVKRYGLTGVSAIVAGGAERYDSVEQGLQAVQSADYVLIHDGARPCITKEVIARCMADVQEYGSAIAAMPVKDTIKKADEGGFVTETPLRSSLYQIQTPQVFRVEVMRRAYEGLHRSGVVSGVTDDAMLVETYTDTPIHLTRGDYRNIKVTTPEDLQVAALFLQSQGKI